MQASIAVASAPARAARVVSLLPCATEMLALIGGEHLLVGRSHECDYPPSVRHLPVVTASLHQFSSSRQMNDAVEQSVAAGQALYSVDAALLARLQPDVLLTQSVCSVCAVDARAVNAAVASLPSAPQVVDLNPRCLADVLADLLRIGSATGLLAAAQAVVASLQARIDAACAAVPQLTQPIKVAFVEWLEPVYAGGHWTPQLIHLAGGCHPLNPPRGAAGADPSVAIPVEHVAQADCDWLVVCPCGLGLPAAWRETAAVAQQPWWQGLRAVREGRVVLVDGNQMFNRPGPRLVDALEWLVGLLQGRPALMPAAFPWAWWRPDQPAPPAALHADSAPFEERTSKANGHHRDGEAGGDGHGEGKGPEEGGRRRGRRWAAPDLPPDIEEAHRVATEAGSATYKDPATGYTVFTEQGMLQRAWCCGNRCRHCPYGHCNVPPTRGTRVNRIWEARHLRPGPAPLARPCVLLPWLGDVASVLALRLLAPGSAAPPGHDTTCIPTDSTALEPVLVVAFDPDTQLAWGSRNLQTVMDHAAYLKLHLLAIPVNTATVSSSSSTAQALSTAAGLLGDLVQQVSVPPGVAVERSVVPWPLLHPLDHASPASLAAAWQAEQAKHGVHAEPLSCDADLGSLEQLLIAGQTLPPNMVAYPPMSTVPKWR